MSPRRVFLRYLISALVAALLVPAAVADADAKDGGHDGGHGGHGHDDDGGDDHGRGNNGKTLSQDEALREVESGKIIPLQRALKIAGDRMSGKVIDISLTRSFGRSQYRIKVRGTDGAISTIRIDARTGSFVGMFGF